jgi:hypothetical protein
VVEGPAGQGSTGRRLYTNHDRTEWPPSLLNDTIVAAQKLTRKFRPMNGDHLLKMPSKSRADKSQGLNLQKGKGAVSMIVSRGVPRSVPRLQLARHCPTFSDDPCLMPLPYAIQSNVSPDAFALFMRPPGDQRSIRQ